MFNGIGLQTPRGSGTSGHVQKNMAVKKNEGIREKRKREAADEHRRLIKVKMTEARRNAGIEVRTHDQKRKIEVKCMELREALEDQELEDLEIDKRVAELRTKMLAEQKKQAEKEKESQEEVGVLLGDSEKNESTTLGKGEKAINSQDKKTSSELKEKKSTLEALYNYVPRYENR